MLLWIGVIWSVIMNFAFLQNAIDKQSKMAFVAAVLQCNITAILIALLINGGTINV